MTPKHCLICYKDVAPLKTEKVESEIPSLTCSLFAKQLKNVFILRELLQVPGSSLETYFGNSGGRSPDCWINVCGECEEMVGEGRRIFEEILKAKTRYKMIQEKVVRKLRESVVIKIEAGVRTLDIGEVVTEETRKFVVEHDYGCFENPFPAGDLEAETRLRMLTQSEDPGTLDDLKFKSDYDSELFVLIEDDEEESFHSTSHHHNDYGSFRDSFPGGDREAQMKQRMDAQTDHDDTVDDTKMKTDSNSGLEDKHDSDSEQFLLIEDDDMERDQPWETDPLENEGEPAPSSSNQVPSDTPKVKEKKRRKPYNWTKRKLTINEEGAFIHPDGRVWFRCQIPDCTQIYRQKRDYNDHKIWHATGQKPKFPCRICGKEYTSRGSLFNHKMAVHDKKPRYMHTAIKKKYPPKKPSEATKEKRRIKNQSQCPQCHQIMDKYSIEKHIKFVHEKVYPFTCEICGYGTTSKKNVRIHQTEAHRICSVETCRQIFGTYQEMRNHQLECHGKEIDVLKCPEEDCERLFVRPSKLTEHGRLHEHLRKEAEGKGEEDKKWCCDLCGKNFFLKIQLTNHINHHKRQRKKKGSTGNDNEVNDNN